jgi:hypothetical protein
MGTNQTRAVRGAAPSTFLNAGNLTKDILDKNIQ